MDERRLPRERELVLAPNEYAWVLDTTKGHIGCYVGPNKTSLAQTDQPVVFDELQKRFVHADELSSAIQLFATAPENWYLVLKNPAHDNGHPRPGAASGLAELQVGKKVIVRGPASFALWPGQMARVVEGHRLQSSQYLVVVIHDAKLAAKDPAGVLGRPLLPAEAPLFEVGQKIVVPGDRTGFYIPPDGVEVATASDGRLVRDAVTLQRLEYCVLAKENGKKRVVRGEAVVFPEPDERFVDDRGRTRFRAIELSPTTGLHLKVTAPYVDGDGVALAEGDELFLTGEKTRLYFPRDEHAIIKAHNGSEVHHAVAIPDGEGRYVLDKDGGGVRLVQGPRMFLADPRTDVIVRRALSDRECQLLFPANDDALAVNRALRGVSLTTSTARAAAPPKPVAASSSSTSTSTHEGMDSFARGFEKPAVLVLDTKYDGAVSVDVWSGYAVCVKDRRGHRRVVVGPQTILLGFDESLESLTLSTGTPKSTARLLSTAFLKVAGNQVSDVVDVVSADLVAARVRVTWRVSFEAATTGFPLQGRSGPGAGEGADANADAGSDQRWFVVDNYVKLLCDHAGSMLKARARKTTIRALREQLADIVRDGILGEKGPEGRRGLAFSENGMRVFDVEVHGLDVVDEEVRALLDEAQHETVRSAVQVAGRETALLDKTRTEAIARLLLVEDQQTRLLARALESELEEKTHEAERRRLEQRSKLLAEKGRADVATAQIDAELRGVRLQAQAQENAEQLKELTARQRLEADFLGAQTDARVRQAQAFSPDLTAALTRLGDAQLLSSLAAGFGELAAVEGKGLLETARKFLDFVPSSTLPVLRARVAPDAE